MACGAILRSMLLPMAVETCAHVVSYSALGNGSLGQIPMARRTGNTRLIMRCMAELHMSFGRKAVNALPGNFHPFISVFNNLFHFRAFPPQLVMTQHAFPDRRNPGSSTSVGAHMTVKTIQAQLYVRTVWKRDWLLCQRSNAKQCDEPKALPSKGDGAPQRPVRQRSISDPGRVAFQNHSSL